MAKPTKPVPRSPAARAITPARDRIAHIVGLMARQVWERGGSQTDELAELWGVARATVEADASEAKRLLDVFYRDGDQVEEYCRIRLHEISEENGPDRVAALTVRLKNLGRLTDKHEVKLEAVPTPDLIKQAIAQILGDPEVRVAFLAELEAQALATPAVKALLTAGVSVPHDSNGNRTEKNQAGEQKKGG